MAQLRDLIVNGASRFLGVVMFNNQTHFNDISNFNNNVIFNKDLTLSTDSTLTLLNTTAAKHNEYSSPALVIGSPDGAHIEIDTSGIMAKTTNTTSTLKLNSSGGVVAIGSDGLSSDGIVAITKGDAADSAGNGALQITGGLYSSLNSYFASTIEVNGGVKAYDTSIMYSINPATTTTYNLGSTDKRWNYLYTEYLNVNSTSTFNGPTLLSNHLYLTGAVANSSTNNTSQIVFGTPTNNHVVISSNTDALVINKDTTTSSPQIVLYINSQSKFPNGISCGLLTVSGNTAVTGTISATSNISSGGNIIVGGTKSATNPYYKLIDSNANEWYFQALNNKCYIGPTHTKALNIDSSGNISAVGSISIGRKADTTMGDISVAIGYDVIASGKYSHAEGYNTTASGTYSHAEGRSTKASGSYSHAAGYNTTASGSYSHTEGRSTKASGSYSHAEGDYTTASGDYSHAEGDYTTASGDYSHAEGRSTKASGDYSHAEGYYTVAPQAYMNVIGANNLYTANKIYIKTTTGYSRAYNISQRVYVYDNYYLNGDTLGYDGVPVYTYVDNLSVGDLFYNSSTLSSTIYECTKKSYYTDENSNVEYVRITYSNHSVVNPATEKGDYVHIVGNGTSSSALSNAHTLDWSGNAWFAGDVYVGSTSGTNKDTGSLKLATEVFVNAEVAKVNTVASNNNSSISTLNNQMSQVQNVVAGHGTSISTLNTEVSDLVNNKAEASALSNYLLLTGGTVTGVTKFSNSTDSTSTATGAVQITGGLGVAKNIRGNKVYGSVWNDYAEYRQTHHKVRPGQCVYEKGNGSLAISYERMMPGANIVSDTFGFAIGETKNCKTPLAVSGRVLAYPYEPKETYNPGDAVCSGPNGTISKMTRAEIRDYPERIVGTVSEIPTYEVWGSGNVKVNGRIWIKV